MREKYAYVFYYTFLSHLMKGKVCTLGAKSCIFVSILNQILSEEIKEEI